MVGLLIGHIPSSNIILLKGLCAVYKLSLTITDITAAKQL